MCHKIEILQVKLDKSGAEVLKVKIIIDGPSASWYVQWIRIQMDRGRQFHCPINAWMEPHRTEGR